MINQWGPYAGIDSAAAGSTPVVESSEQQASHPLVAVVVLAMLAVAAIPLVLAGLS